ncbi:MAG TPA: 2-hydroxyacid dehydrogenase [Xanthobacteraceae bacterium]|jgi:lactate dehydrogenase-like 2-hydroxyacid dehydrogenase|nr:2-hydroxyacid dehydrogenase [Xanthobacteraceae bacterium]
MVGPKIDILLLGIAKPAIVAGLRQHFNLHVMAEAKDGEALLASLAPELRAIASSGPTGPVKADLMARCPKLEIVSSWGVGYDHVDAAWAGNHGIIVTHTPDVLTEEVADLAFGLLLATLREIPRAEKHLRDGRWTAGDYPLTRGTLRGKTVGIVGLGRIGRAIARRLDASLVTVVYHGRTQQKGVAYRYHPDLLAMARDADVLMVVTPGGADTRALIDADVLAALGPDGYLINVARGTVVDEAALIAALKAGTIAGAGLDVFETEPHVPAELIACENAVLLPHVGSASLHTRGLMEELVADNLVSWSAGRGPLTPVPETPWPR